MQKEKFLKEYLVERKGTYSLKWDALDKRFGNADLISMWVADMEIKAPKEVIEALKERFASWQSREKVSQKVDKADYEE